MNRILFVFAIFCALQANAQNYLITFSGTGLSTSVSTVSVENLTTGATLTINGGDILHLTAIITGLNSIDDNYSPELKIYPNPMADNSILQIYPPTAGDAVITIYEMTGKPVAQINSYLENFKQDFRLSGIKSGFYIINVKGNRYQFSGKLLSNGNSNGAASIVKLNNNIQAVDEKTAKKAKGTQATVDMAYTIGDRLKFTGLSGIYGTVMTDIPTGDKTITFDFISCTDGDDNNYPVVQIGTQVWMAENLKTTKYNDGTEIPLVTDNAAWGTLSTPGYCWIYNDAALYKESYGALYNWYTVNTYKLCPTGWHVPTDAEWTTLMTYLGGESVAGGKLKESGTTHWTSPNTGATNETGFTALPGGSRLDLIGDWFSFGSIGAWWSTIQTITDGGMNYQLHSTGNRLYNSSLFKQNGLSVRCLQGEGEGERLAVLTTTALSSIENTTATCGGNITSDGGATVTARGVCWSTTVYPTIADNKTTDGAGTGAFTSSITGLTLNTTYYVRAYATNSVGTNYGNKLIFKTYSETDIDGNGYHSVTIGTQIWMVENLRTTKYNDGTDIPLVTDDAAWGALSTTGYCWYNNDAATNKGTYGALYNWYAVNTGKLCPAGWHVPSDEQWSILTSYLGGESVAGGKLKETGTVHWLSPNAGASDERGFAAFPGGLRTDVGTYTSIGNKGHWWSSTDYITTSAWYRSMNYNLGNVERSSTLSKQNGFSVRCLQNVLPDLTTIALSSITNSTATCGGNVTNDGGATVTARGVCWSTTANPTTSDYKTSDATGTGAFTSSLTGLTPNTTYYVRAYATNSVGTNYGNELIFKTYTGIVTDIDGNSYGTITIGTQTWMAENLKTTKYQNGDLIGTTTPATLDIEGEDTPKYQWVYAGNENNVNTYGRLYTWHAVTDNRNICPTGWQVPTDAEWTILTNYLGGLIVAGGKLKESGTTHWLSPNTGATNETRFTGLPGGFRWDSGSFDYLESEGHWWSASEGDPTWAWRYMLYSSGSDLGIFGTSKNLGVSVRCIQDVLPDVTTAALSSKTNTSAVSGGNVTNDGGITVTSRGVCWSTTANPTTADNKTSDGTGTGAFTSSITGLTINTTYYVRSYATNSEGTNYGNELIFKTYTGRVSDIDGNTYNTVTIGTQTWMAENLKTTKYNDNTTIPLVTDNTAWAALITPGYCWLFDMETTYKDIYGAYYNWYSVDEASNDGKNVCPAGWHVPTDAEWTTLITYLGGENVAGNKLKEAGTAHWESPNSDATNETNFTALPGMYRYDFGEWESPGRIGFWWTSTLTSSENAVYIRIEEQIISDEFTKKVGLPVRCLQD